MSGTPGHSGGARPGAGRKSKTREERLEPTLQQLDDRLEQHIHTRLTALEQLAAGGPQTVIERWELAGTLLIDSVQEVCGTDDLPTGKTVAHKVPALPDKPADELILVSRTIKTLAPNLAANVYLINRLVGTPPPVEAHPDEADPDTLPEFENIVTRIYGPSTT